MSICYNFSSSFWYSFGLVKKWVNISVAKIRNLFALLLLFFVFCYRLVIKVF